MDDTFFGFDTEIPSLGSGKHGKLETEFIDDLEDEYDALNDETFGVEVNAEDDWEDDHEKLAELERVDSVRRHETELPVDEKEERSSDKSSDEKSALSDYLNNKSLAPSFANPEEELEHSITKLVWEDELDDPAIMNISKSKPFSVTSLFGRKSPPPPAILESNHVGSPSTSSIWTSPQAGENYLSEQRFPRLFNNVHGINVGSDPKLEDPCIVGIGEDIRRKSLPTDILYKAKTVDEIEREHLNMSPSPLGSRHFENAVPSHQRTVSFNEMIREMDNRKPSSPQTTSAALRSSSPRLDVSEITRSNSFSNSSPVHTIPANRKSPHVTYGLDVGHSNLSPPYGSPPVAAPFPTQKLGLNILVPPYSSHFIPPQVGIHRPQLMARSLNASQPFLAPLRFPRGFSHVNQMSPSPGLLPYSQPQARFVLPFSYFDNAYRRAQPAPLRPLVPVQNMQRPRKMMNEHPPPRTRTCSTKDESEYDNLMTPKEKEWLIKIQMMQLQTTNPYLDDFYYTTYMMKKKNEEQKKGGGDQKDGPKLVVPELAKTETKTYKPAQYEGSLGKLQAASVNCPRKIIDVDIVHPEDGDGESCFGNKELRRFRQILLEIEKLYSIFLTVDDLEKKMGALPKESHEPLEENRQAAIHSIYNSLSTAVATDEKFVQIMMIRKGWNFVSRALSLFSQEKQSTILVAILNNWTQIMKRINQQEAVQKFSNYFEEVIANAKLDRLVEMARASRNIIETLLVIEPNGTYKSHVPSMLQSKLGATILCAALDRAEVLRIMNDEEFEGKLHEQWCMFVEHIANVLCNTSDNTLPQVPKAFPRLLDHFKHFITDERIVDTLCIKVNLLTPLDSQGNNGKGDAT